MLFPRISPSHSLPAKVERARSSHALSPEATLSLVGKLLPGLASGAVVLCGLGLYVGLFVVPLDPRQGDVQGILYIHVPASWMSVMIYVLMAFCAGVGRRDDARLAPMIVEALAPTGAVFALMTLWTGSLWGKPLWDVWWVWDMRLVADLVLMALYLGVVALHAGIEDAHRADRLVAWVVLPGSMVVVAALASVALWPAIGANPRHGLAESPGDAIARFTALMAVAAGFWMYASATASARLRCVILERERQSDWVARRASAMQ